ncbi:MAG: lipid-A-disaccharide synthase [Gammaproteobacteria bacterium]|jgi:lipid-A-disaccharide synthase
MVRIGIVAGEASGDMLGAGLIKELEKKTEALSIVGIGGIKLVTAGMKVLYPMERLSVMGITEVAGRYFELKNIRDNLLKYFIQHPPDIFIGIDAPDFNLWLEKELRKAGIKTVHYVSPSVWAWREYRVKKIRMAADLVLSLFPFEAAIYNKYGVPNRYVGHPLADNITSTPNISAARLDLNIPREKIVIALLPGSRLSEIKRIASPLLKAAVLSKTKNPNLYFISGLIDEKALNYFTEIKNKVAPELELNISVGNTHRIMESADFIMLASGTATLEAMLFNKPMVVAYKLSFLTHLIVKLLAKIPYASLPNILAGKMLVPECLQSRCTPEILSSELNNLLASDEQTDQMKMEFSELSVQLKKNADLQAADAILELLEGDKVD